MEVPAIQGLRTGEALMPKEQPLKLQEGKTSLRIGIPREVSDEESRVALAPGGVSTLVASGHEVYVEDQAGTSAHFSNEEYVEAGAEVVSSPKEVYSTSDLIVKVYPPTEGELEYLQEDQILVSALHLGNMSAYFLKRLMELRITGIGFEFIQDPDGTYPIVRMMHEISGSMAIQVAARYLQSYEGGKGVMLGGISGVPPSTVVILGAGVVGEWAARTALGYGGHVIVLDNDLSSLRSIEHYLDRNVTTAVANTQYVRKAVLSADVVIGAMMSSGERSPMLVTEEMVASMPAGSVVVDVVVDQGGCIETSRPMTHSDPTFTLHEVIHYCVPNMPSNAARTATYALTNVLVPYLIHIGEAGTINNALWGNQGLRSGTYVYRRHLTKKSLASLFGMRHRDIELLIASGI
jgi:alanine dehydrogenase